MRIVEQDFILTPSGDGDPTFNLQLMLPVLDKKKNTTTMKMKEVAYNISISRAAIMIIQNRVENHFGDSDISFSEYVDKYKEECQKICKALKIRFKV